MSTASLAARLAASLLVDAIELAKPAGRFAAKAADRLLGGSPFNEREAMRFLTMGGSEFYRDGGPTEWQGPYPDLGSDLGGLNIFRSGGQTKQYGPRPRIATTFPSNPSDAAESPSGVGGDQSAPGTESPVEQAPTQRHSPDAGSGAELVEMIWEVLRVHFPEECPSGFDCAPGTEDCPIWVGKHAWLHHVAPLIADRITKAIPPAPFTFGDLVQAGQIVSFYANEYAADDSERRTELRALSDRLIDAGLADPNQ